MSNSLKTILVDLTPVLPGGENGGAKLFVLELIKYLAANNPNTNFILLTQAKAHNELAIMDGKNVSRIMIDGGGGRKSLLAKVVGYIFNKLPFIPSRFSLIGYRLYAKLKRRSLKNIIVNNKPDLIFCPFTAPTYTLPFIPSVCVIYDLQYKTHPLFFDKADRLNRDHAFTEACRLATKLTAVSDYSRNSAIKHGKISADKIKTIHLRMAKRTHNLEPVLNTLLASLNITEKEYLLYPANFWSHKNHEMLFTALNMAYHQNKLSKKIKLVCTGSPGHRQQWLIKAVKKMGLESQIVFTGYLDNTDLAELLNKCAGVIFPSLYEGFGLPILEAMAAHIPVACSNITSIPEVAGNGAIYFDPRKPDEIVNAMDKLVNDNKLCKELIEIANQRVQTFCDSSKMAKEYWELFQEACLKPCESNEIRTCN